MQRRALMQAAGRLVLTSMLIAPIALSPTAALAQTLDLAGAKFPPAVSLAGQPLQLNGAGIRYRFVVKVYAAGLYLTSTAGTPEAVMSASGPKRLQVSMLREIDANELGRLFTRGMQDNATREEFSKLIPGTIRMSDIFSARKRLRAGDSFSVDFVPGVGTTVLVNGQPQAEPIKEPEFFNALMRIWLGPVPADAGLKSALLGRPAAGASTAGPQQ